MSNLHSDTYDKRINEPNFTMVPNIIFDHWLNVLDHCTSLVLLFICRKTLGWHKNKDSLSLSKIESGTNMSRNRVIKSLKILEDVGLIKKELHKNAFGDQDPNTYELIIHEGVVHEENQGGSAPNELGVVHGVNRQKKPLQNKMKENRKSFGDYVKFTDEEYEKFLQTHGKVKTDDIIQDMNDHCVNNRPQGYADYVAASRTFLKNYKPSKNSSSLSTVESEEKNLSFAQSCEKEWFSSTYTCNILHNSVELTPNVNGPIFDLKYSALGFSEQLVSGLRKHGFTKKKGV